MLNSEKDTIGVQEVKMLINKKRYIVQNVK